MQAVGRLGSYISRGVYTVSGPFHPFGGAVDIVLVEQPEGGFKSSPWYVRFGKFQGVLKAKEKVVSISVNGVEANFHMYLDHKGEAFFLREVNAEDAESMMLYPSSSGDETDPQDTKRPLKSRSFNFDSNQTNSMAQIDNINNGNILARTNSDQSRIQRVGSLECAEIAANLLEVNWSTNLASHRPPRKDGRRTHKSSSYEENALNQLMLCEEVCSHNEQEGMCSKSNLEFPRGLGEDESAHTSYLGIPDEASSSKEKTKVIAEVSILIDTAENAEDDMKVKEVLSDQTTCNFEVASSELEASIEKQLKGEHVSGEKSETSIGGMDCSHERNLEVTKTQEVTKNADPGMPIMEVSQTSQQINCSHPSVSKFNIADVEDQLTLSKPQMVNMDLGLCSAEKDDLNCVATISSYSSLGNQALEEKVLKVEDVSSTLTSLESAGDCVLRKRPTITRSASLEDEKFLFSDLDESRCCNQYEGSISPEDVEKDLDSNALGQHHLCYNLSHSLDTRSQILNGPLLGKDDPECIKSADHLVTEEPGAKDNNGSGDSALSSSTRGNWRLWPFSFKRSISENDVLPALDSKDTNTKMSSVDPDTEKNELKPRLLKKNVRAITPTSEQLASLNLKEGKNTVTFTFSTSMLGKQEVDAQIYLWKWNARIVISDVDGTITRSDVLGQFMPLVGVDWSQTGVAHLFSAIKENGYQLLFLSARAISQAYHTRQFLINLKQDGKVLPDGPVVISPDGLFPSLFREVIRRAPHEFKIACLEDIKALFPSDYNPFYAGFGNRDTDEISYRRVGIPKGKIFIINPKGEVVVNRCHDTKSYTSLHALVNGMFPPTNSSEQEDFNSWNYWKLPPPVIDL